jgi:rhamnulokinase
VLINGSLYWNILSIFEEIKTGLKAAFRKYGDQIASIGIDTWGVDYGLFDTAGDLIAFPYHYRDGRTDEIQQEFAEKISLKEIYQETGIQMMKINTIFQLYAHIKEHPWITDATRHFLTLPNLFNYWLTGVMKNEYSITTTTQLYNPTQKGWSEKLIRILGLDPKAFEEIVPSGSVLGPLLPSIATEVKAPKNVTVVAVGCHDTASAVAAVPAVQTENYAYLSSGTWSLLGIETSNPIITDESFQEDFTNEGTVEGGIRFLKNIMGLWIIQECKRYWDEHDEILDYGELTQLAAEAGGAQFRIDPNDDRFLKPGLIDDSMPDRITAYCREQGSVPPKTKGEYVRGVLESLAETYAQKIASVRSIADASVDELYIIGGGSQNSLLCELTASEAGIPVYAGPVEATALGNILVQTVAAGERKTVQEGRAIIKDSYEIKRYT